MPRLSTRPQTEHVVLVVDDQEETLASLGNLLQLEGLRIVTADSGDAALRILRTSEVHVAIVDYLMPRMTGAQLIRAIRTFDPWVQIILQTGYAGERPPRVMFAELDIQGYHDKADDPDRLLLWIDVALKSYRLLGELRERERLQSELVANCSHEFRTPLNIISGYASLLLGGDFGALPTVALDPIERIARATTGLAELVADFLSYAKLEAGVARSATEWIPVADLAQEMTGLAGALLEDRSVRFAVDLADAPEYVWADGVKLRTVLRNLVGNAAKFTPSGTITLVVARDDDTLRFAVRDTGPGIAPVDQAAVFEPFRQLDGSDTRSHGGVGLGLALSRRLARILGGDLELTSAVGQGSTFTLVLPAHRATSGRPTDVSQQAVG